MFLYQNMQYLLSYKISAYKLSKESGVPVSTITEVKTKNRELKGNQIDKIFISLKNLKIVHSLDDLFYEDLSKKNLSKE